MNRQERLSDERFKETSEFTGMSYEANRVGAVGRKTKLTPELIICALLWKCLEEMTINKLIMVAKRESVI